MFSRCYRVNIVAPHAERATILPAPAGDLAGMSHPVVRLPLVVWKNEIECMLQITMVHWILDDCQSFVTGNLLREDSVGKEAG